MSLYPFPAISVQNGCAGTQSEDKDSEKKVKQLQKTANFFDLFTNFA